MATLHREISMAASRIEIRCSLDSGHMIRNPLTRNHTPGLVIHSTKFISLVAIDRLETQQ